MIKKRYKEQEHLIYRLCQIFYIKDIGFVNDLANDLMKDNTNSINKAKQVTIDILEYGILTNRIEVIDLVNKKVYNKSNYKELSKIINENFKKFLDITNLDFPYKYDISYTDYWKLELAKFGLWDRGVLKIDNPL